MIITFDDMMPATPRNGLATITGEVDYVDTTGLGGWQFTRPQIRPVQDYYAFGMLKPDRTISTGEYRYAFNGKENDNEVKGEGNSIDFGARTYDPRLGRLLSIDPLYTLFPFESNYSYAGNNPTALVDDEGKKRTYYITKIAADGSRTTLVVVNKYEVETITTYTQRSLGYAGQTLLSGTDIKTTTFDLTQNIIIDERTGEVYVVPQQRSTVRSNNPITRAVEDNLEQLGAVLGEYDDKVNGGGGIIFTSEIGQGQEKREGYNADAQSENIDLLTAVLGAASAASTNEKAVGFLKSFKQGIEGITIGKDVYDNTKGSTQNPKGTQPLKCEYCGQEALPSDTGKIMNEEPIHSFKKKD